MSCFAADASLFRPVSSELVCGEEWIHEEGAPPSGDEDYEDDDDLFPIIFHITFPRGHAASGRLEFGCRDASCGVLIGEEARAPKASNDGRVDPLFFEKGFYLEAKTGFQIWPGSRIIVEALTCPGSYSASPELLAWQSRVARGANVVEIGAGLGAVGACLAAAGANALVTDLRVLVEHSILPNLKRNARADRGNRGAAGCPPFLAASSSPALRIGRGHAGAAVLDWAKPLTSQLPAMTSGGIDLIVGCDCMWMKRLVGPVLSVVGDAFVASAARDPAFLFTFQRRGLINVFSDIDSVRSEVRARGWTCSCLAWRTITIDEDGENEVYLFEVRPGGGQPGGHVRDFGEEKKEGA